MDFPLVVDYSILQRVRPPFVPFCLNYDYSTSATRMVVMYLLLGEGDTVVYALKVTAGSTTMIVDGDYECIELSSVAGALCGPVASPVKIKDAPRPTFPRHSSESRNRISFAITHSGNTGSMVCSALLEFIGKLVGFFSRHVFSQFHLESCRSASFFHASFISPAGDGLDSRRRVVLIQHTK
jgi:hypothetical protein